MSNLSLKNDLKLRDSNTLQDLKNIVEGGGLSNLPYVDERRNEVLDNEPSRPNPREYYQKNDANPLLAFIEQNMKPERDEDRESKLKKAATVNALGDMLRNVIDLHYGKKGATISKRDTGNPYADRLLKLQEEYRQADDKYEQMRLKAMMQGLEHEQSRQDKVADAEYRLDVAEWENKMADEDAKDRIEGQKDVIDHRTAKNIEYEQTKTAEYIKRQLAKVRAENSSGGSKEDPYFKINDAEGNEIKMSEGTYWDVIKKIRNNPQLVDSDRLANQLKRGENLTTSQLNTLVSEYWNKYYQDKEGRAVLKTKSPNRGIDGLYRQDVINEYQKTEKTNNISKPKNDPLNLFD
jgi:hypothetical protein